MSKLLTELRELSLAATPGPWCEHPNGTSVWSGSNYDTSGRTPQSHLLNASIISAEGVRNVEFVAAANPAVVLALLECVEAADRVVGQHVSGIGLVDSRDAYRSARSRLIKLLGGTP